MRSTRLTALLKPGITRDDRQRILNLMDAFTRADPAEGVHVRDWTTAGALAIGGVPPVAAGERAGAEAAAEGAAAEAGTAGATTTEADANAWKLGWAARGRYFESRLGRNLHPNFPTIDKTPDGIATSIKSIDLNAKTYQVSNSLRYRLNNFVDEVESFKGGRWGGDEVEEAAITGRAVSIAIPKGSMTEEQRAVFKEVRERARNLPNPVDISVTEF
jgi:contact-dependent growth inhibition (CDI) system restriction endonuclease-like protein